MKLFLASMCEPHNFGPGKIIGIANGNKPKSLNIKYKFEQFTPSLDLEEEYKENVHQDKEKAIDIFISKYKTQLFNFTKLVKIMSNDTRKSIHELLPFEDGDTLVSWERKNMSNYRYIVKPFLEELGYEVVLN